MAALAVLCGAIAGFSLNTVRPAGMRTRMSNAVRMSNADHPPFSTRRSTVAAIASLTSLSVVWPCRADTPQLAATWKATDGFNDTSFISFDEKAYEAMRDDEGRTPLFEKAIRARLAGQEGQLTVLEIGTGPFALLALIAARAGARKVYAIEAQPEAAKRARQAIRKAGFESTVEVLEGFSTAITLPEKADLVVAEIVGSIASEEGMYATVRDAQARLVKRPELASSWIPSRCQTWVAPATYALHYALGPPQFDWGKLKEPVRLRCLYVGSMASKGSLYSSAAATTPLAAATRRRQAAAWSTWGCSPECVGLQPGAYGVAAPSAWGCSLEHTGLQPGVHGSQVRLNCRDETLQTLAEPQLLEDIRMYDLGLPHSTTWRPSPPTRSFVIEAARIEANRDKFYAELLRGRLVRRPSWRCPWRCYPDRLGRPPHAAARVWAAGCAPRGVGPGLLDERPRSTPAA